MLTEVAAMPDLRSFGHRWRERAILVLVLHPAEFAEFCVGAISFITGVVLVVAGSPASTATWESTIGGIALAAFGVPQMIASVHGGLRLRHASNVLGCAASLANLLRTLHAGVPVASSFFVAIFALCLFFWLRTDVQLLVRRRNVGAPGIDAGD